MQEKLGFFEQMTNNIGDLKIYNKNDAKKINYIDDIKKGDLVVHKKYGICKYAAIGFIL